jgi:hypothetical protein
VQTSSHPCQHLDLENKEHFCFGTTLENGVQVCPKATTHCKISPDIPVANLLPLDTTSAPTRAPTPALAGGADSPKVDCAYTWGDWGTCSVQCGDGQQKKEPVVTTFPSNGGLPCPAAMTQACNLRACEPTDCKINGWDDWTECSMNCAGGVQYQNPKITQQAADGGIPCPKPKARNCNTQSCHAEQPKCECDPFSAAAIANSAGVSLCDVTGDVAAASKVLRVRHTAKQSAAYHLCRFNKVTEQCKCCHCKTLTCQKSNWGDWGACVPDPLTNIQYRKRTRTLAGNVMCEGDVCPDVSSCPSVTQSQVC